MEKPKTHAYRSKRIDKTPENITERKTYQKIYPPMARMSTKAESPRRSYGDSSQLTSCILDSGATCHVTPKV